MQLAHIHSVRHKSYKSTTNFRHSYSISPNLLKRNFYFNSLNQAWVGDITCIPTDEGWLYLAIVKDLFDKKIVACRVSNKIDRFLAIDTLRDAVKMREVSDGIIFHTDRGSQFTSADFRKEIDNLNMLQSCSAKGHPYDNAVMECFFKFLKKEELNRRHFHSIEQLHNSLLTYICGFYNSIRPHSHNPGLSPNQAEFLFFN